MSNEKQFKTGWGRIDPEKEIPERGWKENWPRPKQGTRQWSKVTDEVKHKRFGGDLNPDWKWPEGTYITNNKWGNGLFKKIKKKEKSMFKKFENPWKRKIDLMEMDSNEESNDESCNGILQTDINNQSSKKRLKEMPTRIIEAMNKMTAQKERVLDELSKVDKLLLQQDLF